MAAISASDLRATQFRSFQVRSGVNATDEDRSRKLEKLAKLESTAAKVGVETPAVAGGVTTPADVSTATLTTDSTTLSGPGSTELKQTFQDFVAGTFYRQMLSSLHDGQDKPAYFHGGQAEDIFQSEMDSRIADDLARRDGASFAKPLYAQFAHQVLGDRR